ncbi:MAG: hypothetical protein EOP83_14080 [Verrucomicrobiaceae bacterium]|nr:MAG: hypothetical protein EOP83_14080 [Verrucomicrobiaceae bacterium]
MKPAFVMFTGLAMQAAAADFELGGEIRTDLETFQNRNWDPADDDGYYLHRIWLQTRWELSEQMTLHIDPIHALSWEKNDVSPVDEDRLAFQGLNLQYENAVHRFTLGRQAVQFGSQRLVSAREGPNVPRAFDGIRHRFSGDQFVMDSFYLREVRAQRYEFDNPVFEDEAQLWGIYASIRLPEGTLEPYYLGTEQKDDRHTFGLRYAGERGALDWDLEGIGQIGNDIRAWSVARDIGYTFDDIPMTPRLGVKASISSGDQDDTARNETFSPLFPKGDYFSESATIGPSNHIELHPTLKLNIAESTTVFVQYAALWRQSSGDDIYDVSGTVIREAGADDGRFIGQEISLTLAHEINDRLDIEVAASYFKPDSAIEDTGTSESIRFGKVSLTWHF